MTLHITPEDSECSIISPIRVDHAKLAVRVYVNTAVTNEIGSFDVEPVILELEKNIPDVSADYIYSCYARASAFTNFMKDAQAVIALTVAEENVFVQAIFQVISILPILTTDTVDG